MGFGEPLIAGLVFYNWYPEKGTIEIDAASVAPWATRERLAMVGAYVARHARLAVFRIDERNERALRLMGRLGARMTVVPEMRAPGVAEVVCTIESEGWHGRWSSERA